MCICNESTWWCHALITFLKYCSLFAFQSQSLQSFHLQVLRFSLLKSVLTLQWIFFIANITIHSSRISLLFLFPSTFLPLLMVSPLCSYIVILMFSIFNFLLFLEHFSRRFFRSSVRSENGSYFPIYSYALCLFVENYTSNHRMV